MNEISISTDLRSYHFYINENASYGETDRRNGFLESKNHYLNTLCKKIWQNIFFVKKWRSLARGFFEFSMNPNRLR